MSYFLKVAECVLLACVMAAGIWVLTLAVPSATISQFNGKTFWEVVSAIGTCAAAVIALGIALRDSMRRRADEMTRARLAAAQHFDRLVSAHKDMKACIDWLGQWRKGEADPNATNMFTMGISQVLATQTVMHELAPLPNNCAYNLARAVDIVSRVQPSVSLLHPATILPANFDKNEVADKAATDLRDALDLLVGAIEECRVAAGIDAKYGVRHLASYLAPASTGTV